MILYSLILLVNPMISSWMFFGLGISMNMASCASRTLKIREMRNLDRGILIKKMLSSWPSNVGFPQIISGEFGLNSPVFDFVCLRLSLTSFQINKGYFFDKILLFNWVWSNLKIWMIALDLVILKRRRLICWKYFLGKTPDV